MQHRFYILDSELRIDPLARVYSSMSNAQILTSINTVDRPAPDLTVSSSSEIFEAIVDSEYQLLSDANKDAVRIVLGLGDNVLVGPTSQARSLMLSAFVAGTTTRANLISLVTGILQSRAAEIGLNTVKEGWIIDVINEGGPL